jgi:hypothetical protein
MKKLLLGLALALAGVSGLSASDAGRAYTEFTSEDDLRYDRLKALGASEAESLSYDDVVFFYKYSLNLAAAKGISLKEYCVSFGLLSEHHESYYYKDHSTFLAFLKNAEKGDSGPNQLYVERIGLYKYYFVVHLMGHMYSFLHPSSERFLFLTLIRYIREVFDYAEKIEKVKEVFSPLQSYYRTKSPSFDFENQRNFRQLEKEMIDERKNFSSSKFVRFLLEEKKRHSNQKFHGYTLSEIERGELTKDFSINGQLADILEKLNAIVGANPGAKKVQVGIQEDRGHLDVATVEAEPADLSGGSGEGSPSDHPIVAVIVQLNNASLSAMAKGHALESARSEIERLTDEEMVDLRDQCKDLELPHISFIGKPKNDLYRRLRDILGR